MRKILIATPAFGGQVTVQTMQSIDLTKDEGRALGWDVRALTLVGSADIADIRNQVLGIVLNTTVDDLLFVDADVAWGPGTFAHIMAHDVDVVAGLYRERTDAHVAYPVRWPPERRVFVDPATGLPLLECEKAPAGFLRLRRSGIEKLAAGPDVHWVRNDEKLRGIRYPFMFDWTWTERNGIPERLSEDFTYCQRWRDAGGTVWVDPALKLNHVGAKVFAGDLMAHLQGEMLAGMPSDPASMARAALMLAGAAA